MNVEPFKEKTVLTPNKDQKFSLYRGIKFFVLSNSVLLSFILFLVVNKIEWQHGDSSTLVEMFAVFSEVFILLLSFVACMRSKRQKVKSDYRGQRLKEWSGAWIGLVFSSLFSLIFLGANIPFPSTLLFFLLTTNGMAAAYSVLFHPFALRIYEANVFQERETILDYVFKYIAIYFSGINYYVQLTLLKLPLLLNKLLAIVFVLLLAGLALISGLIYN